MKFLESLPKRLRFFIKSRRLSRFRRAPKIFIPTPSRWQIVIPFKAISIFLIFFLIAASSYLFLRSDIFLVKELQVEKKGGWPEKEFVSADEVKQSLFPFLARSALTISKGEISKKVTDNFLPVGAVQVKKELPDRLQIFYWERVPVAVIKAVHTYEESRIKKNEADEEVASFQKIEQIESFFVDQAGLIFAKKEGEFNLPEFLMVDQKNLSVGGQISGQQVTAALQIALSFQNEYNVKIQKINLREKGEIEVIFIQDLRVFFDTASKKIDPQISTLQTILARSKIEGKNLSQVDLRYEHPVIR